MGQLGPRAFEEKGKKNDKKVKEIKRRKRMKRKRKKRKTSHPRIAHDQRNPLTCFE